MRLPGASRQYDPADQDRTRDLISQELDKRFVKGGTVEIAGGRIVLTDPATGLRYALTVSGTTLIVTLTSL